MRLIALFLLWFCSSGVSLADAGASATVESLVAPAWVHRDGRRQPLVAGQPLAAGEMVQTGVAARVRLSLPDGSLVRLGQQARFFVAESELRTRPARSLRATLRVVAGAFRFSTSAVSRLRATRDVTIRLPTLAAGIRGTDVWGRSSPDRDFVVLIEGRVSVRRDGSGEVVLDQPLSLLENVPGQPPAPPSKVDPDTLGRYAAETEIAPGEGAQAPGGRWQVVASAGNSERGALDDWDRLRAGGFNATIEPSGRRGGPIVYRVRVAGIATREDAQAVAAALAGSLGFHKATVAPWAGDSRDGGRPQAGKS